MDGIRTKDSKRKGKENKDSEFFYSVMMMKVLIILSMMVMMIMSEPVSITINKGTSNLLELLVKSFSFFESSEISSPQIIA